MVYFDNFEIRIGNYVQWYFQYQNALSILDQGLLFLEFDNKIKLEDKLI